jgi:uncharacterized protein YjbI with pentapeptide repeats
MRGTAATLRGIEDRNEGRATPARRWIAGLAAASAILIAAPAAAGATPFVAVHAKLERRGGGAVVTGTVDWNGPAAAKAPDYMSVGDLRLVAVSEDGHHPKLLANVTDEEIASQPTQDVDLTVKPADAGAIAPGNRIVLTASQHGVVSGGTRTARTYVTVDQLQPFGSRQDRIGRRDCSDVAIVKGAELDECDLVGAFLERALVSTRAQGTRMLLADLTGATLRGADLTGLSVAGGRLNGAEATNAVLDNVSLAGAEATRLQARGATSDRKGEDAGANIFDARLNGADFQGAVLNGVSFEHARLDGANFGGATWNSVDAITADLHGADLTGLKGQGTTAEFADFTDAKLGGASLKPADLEWSILCHTQMPDGGAEDRDCRTATETHPKPVADPYVVVDDGSLQRAADGATIKATIHWNGTAGKSVGDVRAVAVDAATGVPTTVGSLTIDDGLPARSDFEAKVTEPSLLAALKKGNRVVVTATQRPPLPARRSDLTSGSFVTVDTVQPGPGRGRVGSRNCSDLVLDASAPAPDGYDLCDLVGAVLPQAALSGPMHDVDLTGAVLTDAGLKRIVFDGSALGGADLSGTALDGIKMLDVAAPRMTMIRSRLVSARLRGSDLDGAKFDGSTISDTTLATSSLLRATFTDAKLDKVDLAYDRLAGAKLDRVNAQPPDPDRGSSLFLADLTDASLAGSHWADDEAGDRPWRWATLCHTAMPADAEYSGDRDCPRAP